MKKQLIIIAFISGSFFSCTKEKAKTDPVVEKTNILTDGVWHFTDYKYNGGIANTITTYNDLPGCRQDDLRSFYKDGTGEINEGPTKCNSTDPQSQSVQWKFLDNHALSIQLNGEEYYIDKLETHEFRFHRKIIPFTADISYGFSR